MKKTTVYLPDELKARVSEVAAARGQSEASLIRDAIEQAITMTRPRPRGGLFRSGDPIAERADELLAGFGEG